MSDIKKQKNSGFTLVESIAVLLIMGILSVIIVSRWTLSDNELIGQIEVIKSHLRHAQSRAMSSSSNWYIHFETTPAQYTLYNDQGGTEYFPGKPDDVDTGYAVKLIEGVNLSGETYVLFDHLGRPYPNSTGGSGTQQTGIRTIISSSVGNVEIKPETGFVP